MHAGSSARASERAVGPSPGWFVPLRMVLAMGMALAMFATLGGVQPPAAAAQESATVNAATELRSDLNFLAQEHVYLAGIATGAAIAGNSSAFQAAAAELDENSVTLARTVGSVYGSQAEQTFLSLWRAHIGFFADYAMGAASGNEAMKQQARTNLQGYQQDIGAFFASANPFLTQQAVATVFGPHVDHLTMVIDAQAAQNWPVVYEMLHTAAHQSAEIADPLAMAIAMQFPARFPGATDATATELVTTLNRLASEHVYLAGITLNAVVNNQAPRVQAASALTDRNSQELAQAVSSVYGQQAGQTFLGLWRAHIGFFADYAMGAATGNEAMKQEAREDLQGYRQDIGAFFASANPALPASTVAAVFGPHVDHLTGAIDAMAQSNWAVAYDMLHMAGHQSESIADPLALAIIAQFPNQFTTASTGTFGAQAGPRAMPRTGNSGLAAAGLVYSVRPGDTLQSIAESVYGTIDRAEAIREANPDAFDGDLLKPGVTLTIPQE